MARKLKQVDAVLVGMGCDAEVSRYGARWRLANEGADAASLKIARDGIVPVLQSSGVVGTMPNIPANRINSQLDVAGPAFTVSSEEASGITALQLAARALRAGEIDGRVDMPVEAPRMVEKMQNAHRRSSHSRVQEPELICGTSGFTTGPAHH
jgi:3-oxoacyl-(acyl-carrier-protein) synthase